VLQTTLRDLLADAQDAMSYGVPAFVELRLAHLTTD
jgi:hypothetical protein